MFLPIAGDSPMAALTHSIRRLWTIKQAASWAEVMILSPFLLSIVLSAWSAWLAVRSRSIGYHTPRGVRIVAYCCGLASVSMTLLALAYTLWNGMEFIVADVGAVAVIVLGGGAMWAMRSTPGYPMSFIALSSAWAANSTMAMFVVVVHHGRTWAYVVAAVLVAIYIAGTAVAVVIWRLDSSSSGPLA